MIFPQWALFGIITAVLSASCMLMQEKFKVNGFALAFWNKVACVAVTAPFVAYYGFPHEMRFYVLMAVSAVLYAISDVVYFTGISKSGAGTVSRIMPASVIFSFLLWFAIEPSAFHAYLGKPAIAALIVIVLCLWVYCATHLRKCAVSMQAARKIWFVIFAAIVGTVLSKETTNATDIVRGVYGFAFVRALMMVIVWAFFFYARKPVTSSVLFSRDVWRYSLIIGGVNAIGEVLGVLAIYNVDNPAYTAAVGYLNSFFILIAYAVMGRKNDGNVIAGIGMVACAAALIILKAQV
jgi:drug/metabolite transporter (DMT)-like permease